MDLQDNGVGEGDVGGRPVDGSDQRRVEHFGSHFGQAKDGKATVIAPVLEVVCILPHKRETQICQTESTVARPQLAAQTTTNAKKEALLCFHGHNQSSTY